MIRIKLSSKIAVRILEEAFRIHEAFSRYVLDT